VLAQIDGYPNDIVKYLMHKTEADPSLEPMGNGVTPRPTIPPLPRPIPTMSFVAFLFAAVVLAVTPGPGIAYVVARTVAGGRAEGLASCFRHRHRRDAARRRRGARSVADRRRIRRRVQPGQIPGAAYLVFLG